MGFLDWLTGKIECPRCGTGGAKKINGQIHCTNPTCLNFSRTMGKGDAGKAQSPITFREPSETPSNSFGAQPPEVKAGSVAIRYRNFSGQAKVFVGDVASARRNKNHITVNVETSGTRIALSRDRIQNLAEVEAAFPQRIEPHQDWPTPRERQVLNYHKGRRSTSPLYQSIRAKYPNW
jgi:hypothetical protein